MMNAWRVGPRERQEVGFHIDEIYNGKRKSQWFVLQDIGGRKVLFVVTQPTMEEIATLEKPEEYKNDLL